MDVHLRQINVYLPWCRYAVVETREVEELQAGLHAVVAVELDKSTPL